MTAQFMLSLVKISSVQFAKSEVARSLEPLEMMVITRRRISDLLVKLAKATIHHVTSTEIG